jgi:hypothetical protein
VIDRVPIDRFDPFSQIKLPESMAAPENAPIWAE